MIISGGVQIAATWALPLIQWSETIHNYPVRYMAFVLFTDLAILDNHMQVLAIATKSIFIPRFQNFPVSDPFYFGFFYCINRTGKCSITIFQYLDSFEWLWKRDFQFWKRWYSNGFTPQLQPSCEILEARRLATFIPIMNTQVLLYYMIYPTLLALGLHVRLHWSMQQ